MLEAIFSVVAVAVIFGGGVYVGYRFFATELARAKSVVAETTAKLQGIETQVVRVERAVVSDGKVAVADIRKYL